MPDDAKVAEPRILCTHRCLLDEGHDDSVQHQYGYDLPSPNDFRDKAVRFRRAMFEARAERDEARAEVERLSIKLTEEQRLAAATGWDAAVAALQYEDGAPVELASVINPYRDGGIS